MEGGEYLAAVGCQDKGAGWELLVSQRSSTPPKVMGWRVEMELLAALVSGQLRWAAAMAV